MLGDNIKRIRKLKGLTQEDVAQKLDVSSKTISSWEINRTEPSMLHLEQLALLFGCNKSDLIDDENQQKYYTDEKTATIAQEWHDKPGFHLVADACKDAKPEDFEKIAEMIKLWLK